MKVRPYAQALGYAAVDEAMRLAGLPANKQRTFLDDLFVPLIAFYEWPDVRSMLLENDYVDIVRWTRGKLDHEASVDVQRTELEQLRDVFKVKTIEALAPARNAVDVVSDALRQLDQAQAAHDSGRIDRARLEDLVFGAGHHRVMAVKRSA